MTPELPGVPPVAPPPAYRDRRGWLIAFGVVEILIGCLNLFFVGLILFIFLVLKRPFPDQPGVTAAGLMTMMEVTYGGIAAFFITVGIGSIHCRNWARISMIVASILWLVWGVGVIAVFLFLLIYGFPGAGGPAAHTPTGGILIIFLGVMSAMFVGVPLVLLVFYTRKSVRATCLGRSPARVTSQVSTVVGAAAPAAPKLPVPVIILVAWEALGTCAVLAALIRPAALVFGKLILGFPAVLIFLAYSLVAGLSAWLMYHREFSGWALSTFKTSFNLISAAVSFWGRDWMQLCRDMGMTDQQMWIFERFPHFMPAILMVSLALAGGMLVFLFYARKYFPRTKGEVTA